MIWEYQVDLIADFEVIIDVYAPGAQAIDLAYERLRVDDDAVSYYADLSFMEYPGRDEVQDEFALSDHHRVAGVISALIPHDVIGVAGEDIDYLALSLVSPLGSYNDCVCHIIVL